MPQTITPAAPVRVDRQLPSLGHIAHILPTRVAPPVPSAPPRTLPRAWKVVADAGELLNHPRTRWGLLVLTEVLIAAGGLSRPDAALARDAAEIIGSMTGTRRKRPGGPRVIVE